MKEQQQNNNNSANNNNNGKCCTHCGNTSHVVENCWTLHPEKQPANFKPKNRRRKKKNEYANANVDRDFCLSTFEAEDDFFEETEDDFFDGLGNNMKESINEERDCLSISSFEVNDFGTDDTFFDDFGGAVHGQESDDDDQDDEEKINDSDIDDNHDLEKCNTHS